MTTGFSLNFAQEIVKNAKANPENVVYKLGSLSVQTNTPIAEIAEFFGVSRQSVYGWLSGEYQPNEDKLKKADKFIAKLERKLERTTPAK